MRRTTSRLVGVLVLGGLLAGCGGTPAPKAEPTARPTVAVSSAPPAPAPPQVGSCHALTVTSATDPVDPSSPVPCSRTHTSVTIAVGQLDPVADGHLLAIDSATVRAQIAQKCPPRLPAYVGGDRTTQRLSRLEAVWFGPTLEQADAGANWFRCDVVGLRSEGQLLPLPARMKGVLSRPGALDRFGTCGTTAPGAKGFDRVACSETHTWRAVEVIDLPTKVRYLDKATGASADARCKAIANGRAADSLKFSWSFEWPTRPQWNDGRRYGLCWLPQK